MFVAIHTTKPNGSVFDSQTKHTDLAKSGNMKWLTGHIKWAIKNDYSVTIAPSINLGESQNA